jgi:hypothetical protein
MLLSRDVTAGHVRRVVRDPPERPRSVSKLVSNWQTSAVRKPPAPPPEFFVDRSLGPHISADAIRALGYVVHSMADAYPDREDQRVADTQRIADAAEHGWVVLTKDERITRQPDEQAALAASHLRVFALGTQSMTGPEMAERYVANIN